MNDKDIARVVENIGGPGSRLFLEDWIKAWDIDAPRTKKVMTHSAQVCDKERR